MTKRYFTWLGRLMLVTALLGGCDNDDGGTDAGPGDDAGDMTDAGPGESCMDGEQNQDETDVDCGGTCGATCTPGQMCGAGTDCTTGDCTGGTCQAAATCDDGTQNGTETDTDCGGAMCMPCASGSACMMDSDCTSMFCSGNVCTDPVCGNGTVEGTEDCDDGMGGTPAESATCDDDCTTAECGDGVRNIAAGEACDGDGMGTGGETVNCDVDCTGAVCGDGLVNTSAGETCDGDGAGAGGETATCDVDCTTAMCGDSITNRLAGEQCDDGNMDDTDFCTNACTINGPSISLTTDATFNTDTGELDGTVSSGWDGATATLFASDFTLAMGVTLTLTGTNPLRIESAGAVDIAGIIDASGQDGEPGVCNGDGGAGGVPGPGGGAGGDGGRRGLMGATHDGLPGLGSGGGQQGRVDEAGGGGAGHATPGTAGTGDQPTSLPGAGGGIYTALVSLEGGSGGGGGSADDDPPTIGGVLEAGDDGGGGGGGGGGGVAITSGTTITVSGTIDATGGEGGPGNCTPNSGSGGGGSGGTIVLIAAMAPDTTGATLDVSGGLGGDFGPTGGDAGDGELYVGLAPTCADGVQNQDESAIDCGGTICGACPMGSPCREDRDCTTMICQAGSCVMSQCRDMIMNGNETDIDCGGTECSPCADGLTCVADTDCLGSGCEAGSCVSCADGVRNDQETDVDCGGTECAACPAGFLCTAGTDCTSGNCLGAGFCDFVADDCSNVVALTAGSNTIPWEARANNYTMAPSCLPAMTATTGVDVVFSYTPATTSTLLVTIDKPAAGEWILVASSGACGTPMPEDDCAIDGATTTLGSAFPATMGTTYHFYLVATDGGTGGLSAPLNVDVLEVPLTCGDGMRNGTETDVDCGGPDTGPTACPPRCDTGETCTVDSDCLVGGCDAGSCRAFTLLDDFESGAAFNPIWTPGGTLPWRVSTTTPIAGARSAQSGAIGDGQISTLDLTVTCAANAGIQFDWQVDTEPGADGLIFFVDGAAADSWSGAGPITGTDEQFLLAPGMHNLQWLFVKNAAVSVGSDAVWIDNVALVNCTAP